MSSELLLINTPPSFSVLNLSDDEQQEIYSLQLIDLTPPLSLTDDSIIVVVPEHSKK